MRKISLIVPLRVKESVSSRVGLKERRARPSAIRASVFSPRVRILGGGVALRGVAERFLSQGQLMQVAGLSLIPLDISDFPTRHNSGLALRQACIERILAESRRARASREE